MLSLTQVNEIFFLMRLILLFNICVIMSSVNFAQEPEKVVQLQLEAYNSRNIDSFMAVFHKDIELWTLGAESPSAVGWEKVKGIYQELFEISPELRSTVINRSIIGNKVIDYEKIQGRRGNQEDLFLVMIYEVEEGKIRRAWAVRE